jgi:hypothetical protein
VIGRNSPKQFGAKVFGRNAKRRIMKDIINSGAMEDVDFELV